jgi:hypothetical protein
MDGLKRCSKCGIEKCVSEFGKDNSRKDGLRRWCRSCRAISDSKYQQENKVTINEKARISRATRKKKDPVYKFKEVTKCRIRKAITSSGYKKGSETEKILGCSYDEFRNHIESQFGEGMTWVKHLVLKMIYGIICTLNAMILIRSHLDMKNTVIGFY